MQYINYDINKFLPKGHYLVFALVCREWRTYLQTTDMDYITYYSTACQSVALLSELRVPSLSYNFYNLADFGSFANHAVVNYLVDNKFTISENNRMKILFMCDLGINMKMITKDNFSDSVIGASIKARDVDSVVWMFKEFVKTANNRIIAESRLIDICSLFYTMNCVHHMNELKIPINSGIFDAYLKTDKKLIDLLLFHEYVVPDVNLAARLAVAGDLAGMYRMFDARDDRSLDYSGESLAVKAGVLEYLQLLHSHGLFIHRESWEIAIVNNHHHIISWLIEEDYTMPENALVDSTEQDVTMFKLIVDHYPFEQDQTFDYYEHLNVEKAEYIYGKGLMWRSDALFNAFYKTDRAIVDWLIDKGADISTRLVEGYPITHAAAVNGNLKFLKMYYGINSRFPDNIVEGVVEGGYLQIVKWLATIGYHMTGSDLQIAADKDHLHILRWYNKKNALNVRLLSSPHLRIQEWLARIVN